MPRRTAKRNRRTKWILIKEILHWYPITIVIPIMLILILLGAAGVL